MMIITAAAAAAAVCSMLYEGIWRRRDGGTEGLGEGGGSRIYKDVKRVTG